MEGKSNIYSEFLNRFRQDAEFYSEGYVRKQILDCFPERDNIQFEGLDCICYESREDYKTAKEKTHNPLLSREKIVAERIPDPQSLEEFTKIIVDEGNFKVTKLIATEYGYIVLGDGLLKTIKF